MKSKLWIIYIVVGAIFLVWLVKNSIYIVGPEEQGVIRRFGKVVGTSEPGLHFRLPYPIDKIDTPKITKIRRIEIGFRTYQSGTDLSVSDVPEEALMLTGDENIIDLGVIIQYKIKDSAKFLYNVRDIDGAVKDAAEAALREVVGNHTIDDVLTTGKILIMNETQEKLQEILDIYDSGVLITTVQLSDVLPPQAVRNAFKDVASAKEDKSRLVNEAESYSNKILPEARGDSAKIVNQALAYSKERVAASEGDAEKFLAIYKEYVKAEEITEKRMYIETMEKVLPKIKKIVVDPKNQNLINLLDLNKGVK